MAHSVLYRYRLSDRKLAKFGDQEEIVVSDQMDGNVSGVAVTGDTAYVALLKENRVAVISLKDGKATPERDIAIPSPTGVAIDKSGGLIVLSGHQAVRINLRTRESHVLIPDGLQFMVPTRLWPMVTTPLFSPGAKLRMAREWFLGPNSNHIHESQDESVAAFVRRHFGQEMVDRVAEPMLSGVFGGDAERLSVQAVLLRFVTMEREHGSLVRASLKKRKANLGAKPAPLFTSLRRGVQQLVDALLCCLPKQPLRVGNPVTALERGADGWHIPGTTQTFDAVLLAVPAPAAAGLLSTVDREISLRLERIQYTSSVAVALAYPSAKLPPGFGFLVPRSEGRKLMACTFVHNKFSGRAPEGTALLRCFFSSSRVPGLLEYGDRELEAFALQDLKDILGLNSAPQFSCVFRWQEGLPQYEVGHLERAREIEARLAQTPGLQLIGNSLYGVGIPDCIKSARLAVEKLGGEIGVIW